MYGQIFSGVTLDVSTGAGLPNFCQAAGTGPSGSPTCASLYLPFLTPPPAFAPDCGSTPTMDCAAETAILAYFAGPPVGGANAKATQEDGLTARGINDAPLSGAGVKWLSKNTMLPLSVLNPSSGNGSIVSLMLGGLQLAKPFSGQMADSTGYTGMQYEGCPSGPPDPACSTISTMKLTPELALLKVLQAFFQGTSAAKFFGTGCRIGEMHDSGESRAADEPAADNRQTTSVFCQ
jgi:hypothetical protein